MRKLTAKTKQYMGVKLDQDFRSDLYAALFNLNSQYKNMVYGYEKFQEAYRSSGYKNEEFVEAVGGREVADMLDRMMAASNNFFQLGGEYGDPADTLKRLLVELK